MFKVKSLKLYVFLMPLLLSSCQNLDSASKKTYFSRTYSIYREHISAKDDVSNFSIADLPISNVYNAIDYERDQQYNIGDFPLDLYINIGRVEDITDDTLREKNKNLTYFNFHFCNDSIKYSAKIEVHIAYKDGTFDDYSINYFLENKKICMKMIDNTERVGKYGHFLLGNDRISLLPIDIKIDGQYKTMMLWIKNGIFSKPIDIAKEV